MPVPSNADTPTTDDRAPARSTYGVRLVRGPFVRLPPHPEALDAERGFLKFAAARRREGRRLAADLFCGAGGLSLGLTQAGYDVVLAVDSDAESVETHRHHHPGLTEGWDLGDFDNVARIAELVRKAKIEVLAGGPPCQPFSKAGRSKIRHCVRHQIRPEKDERRDLWRAFLDVALLAKPPAVVMENVPDMVLDREMFILRTMVHELERVGYNVAARVVQCGSYGVPQFRQRLILVALRDGVKFDWPQPALDMVTVWNAISDLPEVEGGWRPTGGADGWVDYEGPRSRFQKAMREDVPFTDEAKVFDHITRPVREDDLEAFDLMDGDTRYSDLPEEFRRYRTDIFDDKYKRLEESQYSRTITAHIAKDGYWYIHPRQNRTLTVREAARLQTFPDWFRFAGPPSAAFRQIGNAVPPALGRHLGEAIRGSRDRRHRAPFNTTMVAAALARWFHNVEQRAVPWLQAQSRWSVICADVLLDRAIDENIKMLWPMISRWQSPDQTSAASLREVGGWVHRQARAEALATVAADPTVTPEILDDDERIRSINGIDESVLDLAVLTVPTRGEDDSEEPVLTGRGVLRVAARFTGNVAHRQNRLTDGRLAVAAMIGDDRHARQAHLGLIELAASLCRPQQPLCVRCPLAAMCNEANQSA